MNYCSGDIRVWSRRILLNFCCVSIFSDILIAKISWTVAQTLINHTIFWEKVVRTFRCIYVKCFNRNRFPAEVSTKFQEIPFFRQFKDHNSGREHGNYTNDPIFFINFFCSNCNIYFWVWKYSKFIFMWFPLW